MFFEFLRSFEPHPGLRRRRFSQLGLRLALIAWIAPLAPIIGAPLLAESAGPVPVSPGGLDRVLTAAGSCPTFSWGGVADAGSYELAVLRLEEDGSGESATILRAEIPGSALSWTPSGDDCFDAGRYVWSVRPGGDSKTEWPSGLAFEVRARPSDEEIAQLLEILGRSRPDDERQGGERQMSSAPASSFGERLSRSRTASPAVPRARASAGLGPVLIAAISGAQTATTGLAHGVAGTTASPTGTGLYAANSAPNSYDLVLDGASDGEPNLYLSSRELDLRSAGPTTLGMKNGGGGAFTLQVSGTVNGDFTGNGSGLSGVDADLLDGLNSTAFLGAATDDWVNETGDSMTGNLSTTGNYLWTAPRTYYATIPGSAFVSSNNTDTTIAKQWFKSQNFVCFSASPSFPNSILFLAALDLPNGASIQSITLHAYDNAAGADATFSLFAFRRLLTGTAVEGILFGGGGLNLNTSGNSAAIQTASLGPLGTRGIIDNQNYAYEMSGSITLPTAASTDLRFYGAQIAYTLDGPAN